MRARKVEYAVVTAMALFFAACSDSPAAFDASPAASFSLSNGPDSPGESGVFRTPQGGVFLSATYRDEGLVVRHYQADDTFRCGGPNPDPMWDAQEITNPQEQVDAVTRIARGDDIPVVIYPLRDPSIGFCDWVRNHWLYRGTGTLVGTDNNIQFDASRPVDVYGLAGHGVVVDRDGNVFGFSETLRETYEVETVERRASPDRITLTPADNGGAGARFALHPDELCSDNAGFFIATFEDANLEAKVRDQLGVTEADPLTCDLVNSMVFLGAEFSSITSIVGIQNLTWLNHLELDNNAITDISALSGLTNLGHLRLEGNAISDISPLSGLTGLWNWLDLSANGISDITPLSTLTNLEALFLSENAITDIAALGGLTSLNTVGLAFNADLSDIQPLVLNAGIDAGDFVDLSNVSPALSCGDVATLASRGVTVVSSCS